MTSQATSNNVSLWCLPERVMIRMCATMEEQWVIAIRSLATHLSSPASPRVSMDPTVTTWMTAMTQRLATFKDRSCMNQQISSIDEKHIFFSFNIIIVISLTVSAIFEIHFDCNRIYCLLHRSILYERDIPDIMSISHFTFYKSYYQLIFKLIFVR